MIAVAPAGAVRMRKELLARLIRTGGANLVMRAVTLAAKLLFLLLAVRNLSVADMAIYGLMATTVGIAVTLAGVEFYAFSIRELLARTPNEQTVVMRDQLAFHAAAYALLVPLSAPVFATGILPWSLMGWFIALAIGEHLSQEVTRVLNALFRPVLGTFLFFIRSAAWALVIALLWLWHPRSVGLAGIFAAWALGNGVSLALSATAFARMDWSISRRRAVNWRWIGRGILVAMPFVASAVSYRITELADRYILHFLVDERAVAVYTFYGTIANAVPALLGATLSAILVPRVIQAWQSGDMPGYRVAMRTLAAGTVGVMLLAVPVVYGAVALLLPYFGKPEYAQAMPVLAVLLLAAAVAAVAQVPGVVLYARRKDLVLLVAVVIAAATNTLLNFLLIPAIGSLGAAWATVIAYAAMGLFQLYYVIRSRAVVDPDRK
jgi:O-antigen/teichoic acid export membrane protein